MIFVGDDWSEDHHDVHVMDETGVRLASRRFREGLDGIRGFHELMAAHADDPTEVVVGIEVDRGLWVHALIGAGYRVYAINPVSVSRYRDRHNLAGAKSDQGDAKVLADLVRTDRHNHRPIAGDTPEVEALKVLARAHQNLIWSRTRHTNQLRNALREYYPAALEAFDDLDDRDTLAVLARAPDPQVGARLTVAQIRSVLKRAGRQRNLDRRATEIQTGLRTDQLAAPDAVTAAFASTTRYSRTTARPMSPPPSTCSSRTCRPAPAQEGFSMPSSTLARLALAAFCAAAAAACGPGPGSAGPASTPDGAPQQRTTTNFSLDRVYNLPALAGTPPGGFTCTVRS